MNQSGYQNQLERVNRYSQLTKLIESAEAGITYLMMLVERPAMARIYKIGVASSTSIAGAMLATAVEDCGLTPAEFAEAMVPMLNKKIAALKTERDLL